MEQELMLLDKTLPLTVKEIQIPGKELNTLQKSQYLKNVESTRNEIIKKIDVCMEFQKDQDLNEKKDKLLDSLNRGDFNKLLKKFNDVVSKRNGILNRQIEPLNNEIKGIYKSLENVTEKDKSLKTPYSSNGSELEKCEQQKPEDFIDSYSFENGIREKFNKTKTKLFENKKKLVQSQYKLLRDAILYYKVEKFKELLIIFLKTRNEINKIYLPIIKNKPAIIDVD